MLKVPPSLPKKKLERGVSLFHKGGCRKTPVFRQPVAAQGRAAIFNDLKSLKMEERKNRIFVFPS